jgi:hypothetical protein
MKLLPYTDGCLFQARPWTGQREVGPLGTPGPWTHHNSSIYALDFALVHVCSCKDSRFLVALHVHTSIHA